MPRRLWRIAAVAAVVTVVAAGTLIVYRLTTHRPSCRVSAADVPSCGVWWGAALNSTNSQLPAGVRSNERATGRRLDIVHTYHRWADVFPTAAELDVARSGHRLMINWEPTDNSGKPIAWSSIANGSHDSEIDAEALRLAKLAAPVYLSFSHEPEKDWPVHGTAADFAAAFQHVVRRSRADGATGVLWVWDLIGLPGSVWAARYQQMWPGGAYVDWIGWDPYNWGECRGRPWNTFGQTVSPFYTWLQDNGFGSKPFMLAEYGTVEDPHDAGAKARWLTDVGPALTSMPNLKALLYFDLPAPPANCDWQVSTSPAAQAGYAELARTKPFKPTANRR